jgi:hypothetical protein
MKHRGIGVTEKYRDPVTYAYKGDESSDAERGHISSFNDSCLFVNSNQPLELLQQDYSVGIIPTDNTKIQPT